MLAQTFNPFGINKSGFNLIIFLFNIRGKLSIIRCNKYLFSNFMSYGRKRPCYAFIQNFSNIAFICLILSYLLKFTSKVGCAYLSVCMLSNIFRTAGPLSLYDFQGSLALVLCMFKAIIWFSSGKDRKIVLKSKNKTI